MKFDVNALIPKKKSGFLYSLYIFIVGYVISILCPVLQHTCISSTIIGSIWGALFGDGNQILLATYTISVLGIVDYLCQITTISPQKAKALGLVFYATILVLYVQFFSVPYNSIDAKPILNSLFYAFLGWCLRPVKKI